MKKNFDFLTGEPGLGIWSKCVIDKDALVNEVPQTVFVHFYPTQPTHIS